METDFSSSSTQHTTQRIKMFLQYLGITKYEFHKILGFSNGFLDADRSIGSDKCEKILFHYPELSPEWLLTGKGSMLRVDDSLEALNSSKDDYQKQIPLLPISAQGGGLNDFNMAIYAHQCEQIWSPLKDAEMAITVNGESMSPEYPNGSQVMIKKINEYAFIEWGKVFVLDTCNGIIIKRITKSEFDNSIKCVSLNPDSIYASFDVNFEHINGIYKVLLCMSIK